MTKEKQPTEEAAVWVPTEELVPWGNNPRTGQPVEEVARLIQTLGWGAPIVARLSNREVIAGHTRLQAAVKLGMEWVPVRYVDVDADTAHLMALADNRSGEKAEWAMPDLQQILAEMAPPKMELAGWSRRELDELTKRVARTTTAPVGAEDHVPTAPKKPVTRPGDLWSLGDHRILCGDSTLDEDVDRLLGGEVPAMALTDPPYAIYGSSTGIAADIVDDKMVRPFFEAIFRQLFRVLPWFAHAYIHTDWRSWAAVWHAAQRVGMAPKNCIVWDKGDGGLGSSYANCHEFVGYFAKIKPARGPRAGPPTGQRQVHRPNIIRHARVTGEERQHSAAKPVPVLRELIRNGSDEGHGVLDLFLGSGSTLVAADYEGRRCFAMEIEPKWVDVTVARWEKLTGGKARRE